MTEGEAQVLVEYGWEPNTGLGTMLKYRGRVVHDRRNETASTRHILELIWCLNDVVGLFQMVSSCAWTPKLTMDL